MALLRADEEFSEISNEKDGQENDDEHHEHPGPEAEGLPNQTWSLGCRGCGEGPEMTRVSRYSLRK